MCVFSEAEDMFYRYSTSIWLNTTCVTNLLLGGQLGGLHPINQQVAQQFGHKRLLQMDVDEP